MSLCVAANSWISPGPLASAWMVAARRSWDSLPWVIVGTIAVLAIVAVWVVARRWLGEGSARMHNSPKALFAELCRAHGLASGERQLLLALAECRQLAQPSDVFVHPIYFDDIQLPPLLAPRKSELVRLRDRLFAGLASSDSEAGDDADGASSGEADDASSGEADDGTATDGEASPSAVERLTT